MHKDTIFCGATSTLLLCTTHVIGFNRDLEKNFFRRGFQIFVLIIQLETFFMCGSLLHNWIVHAWIFFLHCMHDLIDMSVMYTYIFMLKKKNENWEEERIFTQRFIKLPSPPVNCIEGKNLIIIVMKNARKLKNLSLLLRVFWYVSPRL